MDSEYVSTRKKKTFTSIASTLFKYYCLSKKKKATKKKTKKQGNQVSYNFFFTRENDSDGVPTIKKIYSN